MLIFDEPKGTNPIYRRLYFVWHSMIDRCYNCNNHAYHNYGLNGVKVCDEWKTFDGFINSVEKIDGWDINKYKEGKLSLDKDKKGNSKLYSVNTCTFISKLENNKYKPNQQKEIVGINPNGRTFRFSNQCEFAKKHNLRQSTIGDCLRGRVKCHRGWHFYLAE